VKVDCQAFVHIGKKELAGRIGEIGNLHPRSGITRNCVSHSLSNARDVPLSSKSAVLSYFGLASRLGQDHRRYLSPLSYSNGLTKKRQTSPNLSPRPAKAHNDLLR